MTVTEALDGGLRDLLENSDPDEDGTRRQRGHSRATGQQYRVVLFNDGIILVDLMQRAPRGGITVQEVPDDTHWATELDLQA